MKIEWRKIRIKVVIITVLIAWLVTMLYFANSALNDDLDSAQISQILQAPATPGYQAVTEAKKVTLPADFSMHPAYQYEWLHCFSKLKDDAGDVYYVQWNFSRLAVGKEPGSGWDNPNIYISDIIISNHNKVWKQQREARGGIGQARYNDNPYLLAIDNWHWQGHGQSPFPASLKVSSDEFSVQLSLNNMAGYVLTGKDGYQVEHDHENTAYYGFSAPNLKIEGKLTLNGKTLNVSGQGWFGKNWGSSSVLEHQHQGMDWFVFRFANGQTLTLNRHRYANKATYRYGSLIQADDTVVALTAKDFTILPLDKTTLYRGHRAPLQWVISVPRYNLHFTVDAIRHNMWLPFILPYWQGPVVISDTANPAWGIMQLSGY